DVPDAAPGIDDAHAKDLRPGLALHVELDAPAAGVAEGIARDLGHRGGDARLILSIEAEQLGQPARALAADHDIALLLDADPGQRNAHAASLATTTVTSSRPRARSRQSTPATRLG